MMYRRMVTAVSLAVLLSIVPCLTTAQQEARTGPHIHVIQPPGGDIQAVEFRDATGHVTQSIAAFFQLTVEHGRRNITEVKIQAVPRHVLVLESTRMETDLATREQTGQVWDVHNTITLYHADGQVLFQRGNLACFPVALSASGHSACLISPPDYWEGPPAPTAVYPPHDTLLIFSPQGEIVRDLQEPRWQVKNVQLSPSGTWLAYVTGKERATYQVQLFNLPTGKEVIIPAAEDQSVMSYQEVLDTGDLRAFEHVPVRQPEGRAQLERRPKTLYKMEQ